MRVIYGINPVAEALKGRPETVSRIIVSEAREDRAVSGILKAAGAKGIRVDRVSRVDLDKAAGTTKHQGVAAFLYGEFAYREIDGLIGAWRGAGGLALFVILDSIQDPQNLGSLIRSSYAAGANGVIIPRDRACEVTPAVIKASAGAAEHMMVAREVNITRAISRLKEENVWVAALEAGCPETIYEADLKRDLAIVVGSEGKGIRRLVRENCDFCVSIPMAGEFNSLNAAQAGTIALFEARRQRLAGRNPG